MLESIMESISKLASDISGAPSIMSTLNAFPEGPSMGIMRNAVSTLTGQKDVPLSAVVAMNTAQQGPKSFEPELGGTTQVARATSNDRGMSV